MRIPEIRQELKDSRTMVHAKDVETQKFGTQLLKDVTRDFASTEMIWQKNLKDKHDWKKPSETLTRLEEFGDVEDLLTFRRPNPCYIPTLDAMIVSCHLFDVSRPPQ